jgi:hypothetical protein
VGAVPFHGDVLLAHWSTIHVSTAVRLLTHPW